MSDFIEKANHEGHTEALQGHILHGKAPESHPSMARATYAHKDPLPHRSGVEEASIGKGFGYTPHSDAGHTVK